MRITETLQFDQNEYDAFRNAFRWYSVSYSINATDEEIKAMSKIMEKNFRFNKHRLVSTYNAWNKIYAELKARQENLTMLVNDPKQFLEFLECPESASRIVIPLFVNPVQFCKDQVENLKRGMVEVSELLSIMSKAIEMLKDDPSQEDEDSE